MHCVGVLEKKVVICLEDTIGVSPHCRMGRVMLRECHANDGMLHFDSSRAVARKAMS